MVEINFSGRGGINHTYELKFISDTICKIIGVEGNEYYMQSYRLKYLEGRGDRISLSQFSDFVFCQKTNSILKNRWGRDDMVLASYEKRAREQNEPM